MADEQTERATIILQARHDPRMLSADSIVALGQTCGNRCVQRLLASRAVQAKLTVNPPDDQYETEADAVADRVMKTASVQRQTSPEEKEEGQEIQTHSHHRKRLDAHEVAPLQRTPGSRAVAGLLPATNGKAILQPGGSETLDISREPEPTDVSRKEGKEGETESAESKGDQGGERKKSFDLDQWLSGKLYDLVKEQLGEDKLKEYAKKLSKAATDQLLTQVKGATSVDDFSKKIVVNEIGETLKADLNKALTDLLGSAEGQKVKQAILAKSKKDPGFVVGMILMALGVAIATDADIPDLEKTLNLGAGFKAGASANLGKFQHISLNKLKASFSFTSKYFQASVSGGYETKKGKGGFGGKAEASAGTNEVKFTSAAEVDKEGNLKLDLREVMDFKNFGLTAGPSYESLKGWSGVLQLKIGNKYQYLTPKVTVDEHGKAKIELGHTFTNDMFTLATVLKGKEELSEKLDLKNPFGMEGVSLSANIALGLEHPKFKSAELAANIKLTEGKEGSPIPVLSLTIGGKYQAAGPDKAQDLQGNILLVGHWK